VIRSVIISLAVAGLVLAYSCQNLNQESVKQSAGASPSGENYTEAIKAILSQDEQLGAIRNHASEDTSLAVGIRQYVDGLDRLDFSACPEDFTQTFRQHRDAWVATIGFFERFDNERGELHEIWEVINQGDKDQKAEFEKISRPITDSWTEIEVLARKYGLNKGD